MGLRTESTNPSTPAVAVELAQALLTNATCAASGAWTYTSTINVSEAREITLYIDVNAATAASGAVGFKPVISAEGAEPAAGADVWFGIGDVDSTAATDLSGTVPSGADWTLSPESAVRVVRDLVIKTELSNAATDEYRMTVTLKVAGARWLQIAYAEIGATGSPSLVNMKYARHA